MDINQSFIQCVGNKKFRTILADPPWQFNNRTGKMAPEHKRLNRYQTLALREICEIPVQVAADHPAHLYLWVPNALLNEGLEVMRSWGFTYKTNIIWHKVRKDGGLMGAVWVFISEIPQRSFFLAFVAPFEHSNRAGRK